MTFSQLNVDAGQDTTICVTWNSTSPLILGGNPTASGGTAPYTYSWEANYVYTVGSFTTIIPASTFLSDTTIANPNFVYSVESPVVFSLKVSDALGQITFDTVIVSFSTFGTHLLEYSHSMFAGDSIKFVSTPNVGGGTPPFTYLWKPNNGLIDSTLYNNFWLKPIVSTSYYITVTDSVGCVVSGTPVFHIYIDHLGIDDLLNSAEEKIVVYPNPTNGKLLLKNSGLDIYNIKIFNHQGKLLEESSNHKEKDIDLSSFEDGTYTIVFTIDGVSTSKQIIKTK